MSEDYTIWDGIEGAEPIPNKYGLVMYDVSNCKGLSMDEYVPGQQKRAMFHGLVEYLYWSTHTSTGQPVQLKED